MPGCLCSLPHSSAGRKELLLSLVKKDQSQGAAASLYPHASEPGGLARDDVNSVFCN